MSGAAGMTSGMDDGGWGPRRVALVVTAGILLVVAVVGAIYLVTGDEADPAAASDALAQVESPGDGWNRTHDVADQASARAHYRVGWRVRVNPGDEEGLCAEAAAWLLDAGALMPGEPVFEDENPPVAKKVGDSCVRAMETFRGAGSDVFATWPNTYSGGYQFGPYLIFETDGGPGGALLATVEARRQE